MTQLTKTDEKLLSAVAPFLDSVQKFVDSNIQGSNAMTAAKIYESLKPTLDEDTFVKGFRLAVRVGKITGIEGAKRLGYRRIGAVVESKAAESALDDIEPYLNDLQTFVDRHIQGDVKMTAAVIFNKFKAENGCELEEEEFIKLFRLSIREERITGLESAYRFGYKRAGTGSSFEDDSEDSESEHDTAEIIIDDHRRVIALDRLNWGYQVRKDSGKWHTESYYGNTDNLLRGLARKLLDDELKTMNRFNLKELYERLEEAEKRVSTLLVKAIGGNSPVEETEAAS